MNVALCCIAKSENKYIREFVEHYKLLGFSSVFIYDNNDVNGERFEDVISDYIENGFVKIVNFRGKNRAMFDAYNDCYRNRCKGYDWVCFFDCDEFLTLQKDNSIDKYLSRPCFENYDMIAVNWELYGDNDLVTYEDKPIQQRFTKPMDKDFYIFHGKYENRQIKTILRTNLKGVYFGNPHFPFGNYRSCNASGKYSQFGKRISGKGYDIFWDKPLDYGLAKLKHYRTKTAEEFANKILRGYPDIDKASKSSQFLLSKEFFFKHNKKTAEKEKFFKHNLTDNSDRHKSTHLQIKNRFIIKNFGGI